MISQKHLLVDEPLIEHKIMINFHFVVVDQLSVPQSSLVFTGV